MTQHELMQLYYKLADGTAWNPHNATATFKSRASARVFKAAAPKWTVKYRIGT